MAGWSHPTALTTRPFLMPFISSQRASKPVRFGDKFSPFLVLATRNLIHNMITSRQRDVVGYSNSGVMTQSETEDEEEEDDGDDFEDELKSTGVTGGPPPVRMRRQRYRKLYPGEKKGITEEMRFVAMKLSKSGKPKKSKKSGERSGSGKESENETLDENDKAASKQEEVDSGGGNGNGESWRPSMEGFLKYLVDCKLVFSTIERIVDESSDVSYAYFRKTGLERSESLSKDLEWLSQQGNVIPEPSNPGVVYAKYLEKLGEKSPCLFLSHFYNIYFSHVTGGQVIAKKVSENLLEGRELQFYKWEGEEKELLRSVRENLNAVGKHWSRDDKNKCLREATKAFRYLGQMVRLIIL